MLMMLVLLMSTGFASVFPGRWMARVPACRGMSNRRYARDEESLPRTNRGRPQSQWDGRGVMVGYRWPSCSVVISILFQTWQKLLLPRNHQRVADAKRCRRLGGLLREDSLDTKPLQRSSE